MAVTDAVADKLFELVDLFFFFKQKTAYEMRISDWSSDVCSSDLALFVVKVSGRPLARSQPRTDLPGSPAHRGAHPEIISPEPLSRGRQAPVGFLLAWSLGLARLSALRRHRSRAGKCLTSYVTNMGRNRRFGPVKKPFDPAQNY